MLCVQIDRRHNEFKPNHDVFICTANRVQKMNRSIKNKDVGDVSLDFGDDFLTFMNLELSVNICSQKLKIF